MNDRASVRTLALDALLSDDELAVRDTVRKFCDEHITPDVAEWFETGDLRAAAKPAKQFGGLGLLGRHRHGYGCGEASAAISGLACVQSEATDSGIELDIARICLDEAGSKPTAAQPRGNPRQPCSAARQSCTVRRHGQHPG